MNSVMSEAEGMELYKLLSELWVKGGMKTHSGHGCPILW